MGCIAYYTLLCVRAHQENYGIDYVIVGGRASAG